MLPIQFRKIENDTGLNAMTDANIHPAAAACLARRGVADPRVAMMQHRIIPYQELKGIDVMAAGLADAIIRGEKMVVVADYDCDGATACAVAVAGLSALGGVVDFVVPNRLVHGYGLTPSVVDVAAVKEPRWIVTVDNGIASVDGVQHANDLGIGVWVTDHHLPGDTLPDAAGIVNPNQPGCGFGSKHLAGVGVMFYVLAATASCLKKMGWEAAGHFVLSDLLDLVALGTVADVVRLDDNNRWLVHNGLQRIRAGLSRPGIQALFLVSGRDIERATSQDFGFSLGPRLNAAGRLDDMSIGIRCLLATDRGEAEALASQLNGLNEERKHIEGDMKDEALASIDLSGQSARFTRVVFGDGFHEGVIGIVAGRIKEKDYAPTVVFAPGQDGCWKGSGRSIPGLHLRDALDMIYKKNPGWFLKFGGHAMAAGLTLTAQGRDGFADAFENVVRELLDDIRPQQYLLADGVLDESEITLQTAAALTEHVWGQGFEEPTWVGDFIVKSSRMIGKDANHLKMKVCQAGGRAEFEAVQFFQDSASMPMEDSHIRMAYRMQVNVFREEEKLDLIVVDRS